MRDLAARRARAVRRAAAATHNGRIGVIGTAATIASGAYQDAFAAARDTEVIGVACPRFVDFVERGVTSGRQVLGLAEGYLEPLQRAEVDTLVLGCTHYPLLKPLLQRVMGPEVRLIDSGQATAAALETILTDKALQAPEQIETRHRFVVSDDEARFRQVGARFIGERLGRAEVVSLG